MSNRYFLYHRYQSDNRKYWEGEYYKSGEYHSDNLNSHVYHNDSCMSLPAEKNRIYFMYAKDAETAGYRPCNMCIEHSVDENSEKDYGFFDPLLRFIMPTA